MVLYLLNVALYVRSLYIAIIAVIAWRETQLLTLPRIERLAYRD